ncbi:MAG: leucine-rich repeat protein [Atopobiaceae bacterium]|nr:leucine-rich repeat protein [Atopobiaceae bacterium]
MGFGFCGSALALENEEVLANEPANDVIDDSSDLATVGNEDRSFPVLQSVEEADIPVFETAEEAALYLREKMKIREGTIQIGLRQSYSGVLVDIFDQAVAHTGVPTEGDYLRWQHERYSANWTHNDANVSYFTYQISYYTTREQEEALTQRVNEVMAELIDESMSDYQKVRAIYYYICGHVAYDSANMGKTWPRSAYAAMMEGKAVCQGYASLFYRMALQAGIDNRFIKGIVTDDNGGTSEHGWNIVNLGGVYYNIDATWDSFNAPYGYKYYLRGSNEFTDHAWDQTYNNEYSKYNISYTDYPIDDSDYILEGTCDNGLLWSYAVGEKKLIVSGEGTMEDYSVTEGDVRLAPWHALDIEQVEIAEGVTTIGDNAFFNLSNLSTVSLPLTLQRIGTQAFYRCESLTEITVPDSVTSIGNIAFGFYYAGDGKNSKIQDFTITCGNESAAEDYATIHEFNCIRPVNSLDAPEITLLANTTSAIRIDYTSVLNAKEYVISGFEAGQSVYSEIARTADTSFSFQPVESGKYYTFKVKAVLGKVQSESSDAKGIRYLVAPTITQLVQNEGTLSLAWAAGNGTFDSAFKVYRRTAGDSEWTLLASTREQGYSDSQVIPRERYEYAVTATYGTNESARSGLKSLTVSPVSPSGVLATPSGAKTVSIAWVAPAGSDFVEVWRTTKANAGQKDYVCIGIYNASSQQSTSKLLVPNRIYYYKLRAYAKIGDKRYYSGYSKIVNATPKVNAPTNVKAQPSSKGIVQITWTAQAGSDFVEVWRTHKQNATQSEYVCLGIYNASDCKSYSRKLTSGKKYYYKLRAYAKVDSHRYYSGYSTIVSATSY